MDQSTAIQRITELCDAAEERWAVLHQFDPLGKYRAGQLFTEDIRAVLNLVEVDDGRP